MIKQFLNLNSLKLFSLPFQSFSQKIKFTLIDSFNQQQQIIANEGESLLPVIEKAHLSFVGACEGNLVCGTCHIVLDKNLAKKLQKPGDKELDLLDSIIGSKSTSRLACQLKISKEFENGIIYLPKNSTHMNFKNK